MRRNTASLVELLLDVNSFKGYVTCLPQRGYSQGFLIRQHRECIHVIPGSDQQALVHVRIHLMQNTHDIVQKLARYNNNKNYVCSYCFSRVIIILYYVMILKVLLAC